VLLMMKRSRLTLQEGNERLIIRRMLWKD